MSPQPPNLPKHLDRVLAEAWRLLVAGAGDPASAFHWLGLATVDGDSRPRLRTVVLRGVEPAERRLIAYTDARSDKVAEIAREPRVALHAYCAANLVQIRLEGEASVRTTGPEVDVAWVALKTVSRRAYGIAPDPGQPIAHDQAYERPRDEAAIAAGRTNFALIEITAAKLEYLHLDPAGHRRARFAWTGEGIAGHWIVP